jgi:uncharacterized membrane protein (UPF0127 family)
VTHGKLLAKSGAVLIASCQRTTNAFDRMRGLLFRAMPAPGTGLLIDPCASVHTFAMSYPIDVIYLDRDFRVMRLVEALRPWRLSACRTARMTLELAAGQAKALGLTRDMELEWCAD